MHSEIKYLLKGNWIEQNLNFLDNFLFVLTSYISALNVHVHLFYKRLELELASLK